MRPFPIGSYLVKEVAGVNEDFVIMAKADK
jgi:hypothetical protein